MIVAPSIKSTFPAGFNNLLTIRFNQNSITKVATHKDNSLPHCNMKDWVWVPRKKKKKRDKGQGCIKKKLVYNPFTYKVGLFNP